MKKIITTALVLLAALSINAQYDNCDINVRKHISETATSYTLISLLAKGDVTKMSALAESLGGKIKFIAGDIISLELPQNQLAMFATSGIVTRIESRASHIVPLNDTMRMNNNVNEIQQGLFPLPQAYDGAGVVTGFVDTGIDYNHPDFKDSLGNSRIAWIWDQKKAVAPNTPMPYGYGQEWSNTDIDAGLAVSHADVTHYGHGTGVAGIAAGNGLAAGLNMGCAPKADIIMVAYDFDTVVPRPNAIADGINYIFNKANAMGKPCVINLSLGDLYGSFDGKDLEAQAIDNMLHAQPGRLIVSAAGNWAGNKTHLGYTVTSDTTWTWFKYDPAFQQLYLELYGDSADMVNLKFAIGVDQNTTSASYLGHSLFRTVNNISASGTTDIISGVTGTSIVYHKDKVNGVYQVIIDINTANTSYYWRLMTTGAGKFGMRNVLFASGYPSGMVFDNLPPASVVPEIAYYKYPDSLSSLSSSFNCLDDVISVGYYWNRNSNLDCGDSLRFNTPYAPGSLVTTSSLGPTRDGRQKPDITASGNYVMAPLPVSLATLPNYQISPKLNKGCYHYTSGGSSSAAPIVAGIGALYLQKNPNATPGQFKQNIICGAKLDAFTGTNLPDYSWGYGKVNGFQTMNNCFVGINELNANGMYASVQPNPFNSSTTIHVYGLKKDFKTMSVNIYNVLGKKMETVTQDKFSFESDKATIKIDRKQLIAGIYFFTVVANDKVVCKGKLVVE